MNLAFKQGSGAFPELFFIVVIRGNSNGLDFADNLNSRFAAGNNWTNIIYIRLMLSSGRLAERFKL